MRASRNAALDRTMRGSKAEGANETPEAHRFSRTGQTAVNVSPLSFEMPPHAFGIEGNGATHLVF